MGKWADIDFKGKENSNTNVNLNCPTCRHKRTNKNAKSLSVHPTKGLARCWYCDDTFFKDDDVGEQDRQISYEIPPQTWENYTSLSDGMVKWFNSRGLSQITLDEFKIGEKEIFFPSKNKKMNATVFNYFMNGTVVSEHYRSGAKDFSQIKDAVKSPYNIDSIKDHDYVLITEGEIDCMSWHEIGYESCVAVDGASHFSIIESFKGSFDGKKIYLGLDKDYVGVELEKKIIELFGKSRCYQMYYPDDCKDPNDVLVKYGKEVLVEVFNNAVNVALLGDVIEEVSTMNYNIENWYSGNIKKGMNIGMGGRFDNEIMFRENSYHIIVAKTGIGKTMISFFILYKLALIHGSKMIILSTENSNTFARDYLMAYHLNDDTKTVFYGDRARWDRSAEFVDSHFKFLNNTAGYGLEEVLSKAEAIKESFGGDFLLLDPINSIPVVMPEDVKSEYGYHVWAAARMLRFSKSVMSIIMNSHTITSSGRNDGEPPSLYHIEMGGVYINKCDVGFVFDRPINHVDESERNTTRVWSAKYRDAKMYGGVPTAKDDPLLLRYTYNGFEAITKGLYSDENQHGNYI